MRWIVRMSQRWDVATLGQLLEVIIYRNYILITLGGIQRVFYLCNQSQAFMQEGLRNIINAII